MSFILKITSHRFFPPACIVGLGLSSYAYYKSTSEEDRFHRFIDSSIMTAQEIYKDLKGRVSTAWSRSSQRITEVFQSIFPPTDPSKAKIHFSFEDIHIDNIRAHNTRIFCGIWAYYLSTITESQFEGGNLKRYIQACRAGFPTLTAEEDATEVETMKSLITAFNLLTFNQSCGNRAKETEEQLKALEKRIDVSPVFLANGVNTCYLDSVLHLVFLNPVLRWYLVLHPKQKILMKIALFKYYEHQFRSSPPPPLSLARWLLDEDTKAAPNARFFSPDIHANTHGMKDAQEALAALFQNLDPKEDLDQGNPLAKSCVKKKIFTEGTQIKYDDEAFDPAHNVDVREKCVRNTDRSNVYIQTLEFDSSKNRSSHILHMWENCLNERNDDEHDKLETFRIEFFEKEDRDQKDVLHQQMVTYNKEETRFEAPPETFTLHFKRFEFHQNMRKISTPVTFPDSLILSGETFFTDPNLAASYKCTGFIRHAGIHYKSYMKLDGQWWELCDLGGNKRITEKEADEFRSTCYLAFLKKEDRVPSTEDIRAQAEALNEVVKPKSSPETDSLQKLLDIINIMHNPSPKEIQEIASRLLTQKTMVSLRKLFARKISAPSKQESVTFKMDVTSSSTIKSSLTVNDYSVISLYKQSISEFIQQIESNL